MRGEVKNSGLPLESRSNERDPLETDRPSLPSRGLASSYWGMMSRFSGSASNHPSAQELFKQRYSKRKGHCGPLNHDSAQCCLLLTGLFTPSFPGVVLGTKAFTDILRFCVYSTLAQTSIWERPLKTNHCWTRVVCLAIKSGVPNIFFLIGRAQEWWSGQAPQIV